MNAGTCSRLTPSRETPPPVALHYTLADGHSHTGALVWSLPPMRSLEWFEDFPEIAFVKTDPVILYPYFAGVLT